MQRVLVVDDEGAVRRCLARELRTEYAVETAEDGAEAMEKIESFRPDAIISDEGMPGMTGSELLVAVERLQPGCVRVLLSGAEMLDAPPGVETIAKPWNLRMLLDKLRGALSDRDRRAAVFQANAG